ncbi:MAG: hypothetical protein EOO69_12885 [Moraxellaceae bacterium]|nr:MAG: hypothetical protein EOO69_12885 [Moraxellaceae bacterium]
MTFIIAIQLEDSVVVAADHRITIENRTTDNCYADSLQKIRFWQQGIITGTGESLTLERIFQIFQQDHNPQHLPALLYESCKYRQQEIGLHPQLAKTRLLYSQATEKGICLKPLDAIAMG